MTVLADVRTLIARLDQGMRAGFDRLDEARTAAGHLNREARAV